jgi:4-hydroxy-tetrahydrodipicolinate synthase
MNPKELLNYFKKGVVQIVMTTPIKRDGEVDYEGLRQNTSWLIEKRAMGPMVLTPLGSTGEIYSMNETEYSKIIKIVIEESNGKVPVVTGASDASTIGAIRKAKIAEDLGADGVLVVSPYYHVPQEEGLYLHYKKLAEEINIGYEPYNNIDVSKIYLNHQILKRLVDTTDNIVGIKENSPFIPTLYNEIKILGDNIPVLQGRGEWWYAATVFLGVTGYVSAYANFMPEVCLDLLKAGNEKDYNKLNKIIKEKLDPIDKFIMKVNQKYGATTTVMPYPYLNNYMFLAVNKAIMDIMGLSGGHMRLPLLDLTEEDKKELEKVIFDELKLEKVK